MTAVPGAVFARRASLYRLLTFVLDTALSHARRPEYESLAKSTVKHDIPARQIPLAQKYRTIGHFLKTFFHPA